MLDSLKSLGTRGSKLVRLDAFGYATKTPGTRCFFQVLLFFQPNTEKKSLVFWTTQGSLNGPDEAYGISISSERDACIVCLSTMLRNVSARAAFMRCLMGCLLGSCDIWQNHMPCRLRKPLCKVDESLRF